LAIPTSQNYGGGCKFDGAGGKESAPEGVNLRRGFFALRRYQEAAFFFSAHLRLIASASFLRPAGVIPPRRLVGAAALAVPALLRRAAHRRFIASDKRRRPSAVMPLPRRPRFAVLGPLTAPLASSRRAAIARPSRSLSDFSSFRIELRSTCRSQTNRFSLSMMVRMHNYNHP
jgi:hypothetical protein